MHQFSITYVFNIHDEFKKRFQSWLRLLNDVLVANDMDWNLGIQPKVMEVFPDSNVLLNELGPHLRKFTIVFITDRSIVGASANHIEKTGY